VIVEQLSSTPRTPWDSSPVVEMLWVNLPDDRARHYRFGAWKMTMWLDGHTVFVFALSTVFVRRLHPNDDAFAGDGPHFGVTSGHAPERFELEGGENLRAYQEGDDSQVVGPWGGYELSDASVLGAMVRRGVELYLAYLQAWPDTAVLNSYEVVVP